MQVRFWLIILVAVFCSPLPASAQTLKAKLIEEHGAWSVYDYDLGGRTVCFAAARASRISPKDVVRKPVRAYVSTWPDIEPGNPRHVREISFRIGADVKSANVKIDGKPFTLFGQGEQAFVLERAQEEQMLDAMRRGKTLTITAAAKDGLVTSDVYSLKGITASLKALDKHCADRHEDRSPAMRPQCLKAWNEIQTPQSQKAKSLMALGPEHAKKHYSQEQINLIGDYFAVLETMKFRCATFTPPPDVNSKRQ